jgi:hypothetical protein
MYFSLACPAFIGRRTVRKPFGEKMKSATEAELGRVDFARLADWVEGRLSREEAVAVEKRVAQTDETTLADVAWLRRFVEASNKIILPAPPPKGRKYLMNHFEVYVRSKRQPNLRKCLVAKLVFDSGLRPVAGVREAGATELERQLVYAADVLDVAIDILPHDHEESRLDLEGQVLPKDEDAEPGLFSVQLLQGERELGVTVSDDLGEFAFESVPPGVYEMLLSTDKYDIVVAPVQLAM